MDKILTDIHGIKKELKENTVKIDNLTNLIMKKKKRVAVQPVVSALPVMPAQPVVSVSPVMPGQPFVSALPVMPAQPVVSASPVTPINPEISPPSF